MRKIGFLFLLISNELSTQISYLRPINNYFHLKVHLNEGFMGQIVNMPSKT